MVNLRRLFRHLSAPQWWVKKRYFPASDLARITQAVAASETRHDGEIRFAIESALSPSAVLKNRPVREHAIQAFSDLRIWDTEQNNGVLIYFLLADRDFEIVADRGLNEKVSAQQWQSIANAMEAKCRQGQFADAVIEGIELINTRLCEHFPYSGKRENEVPDQPVFVSGT